jgi:hypothetical protein
MLVSQTMDATANCSRFDPDPSGYAAVRSPLRVGRVRNWDERLIFAARGGESIGRDNSQEMPQPFAAQGFSDSGEQAATAFGTRAATGVSQQASQIERQHA